MKGIGFLLFQGVSLMALSTTPVYAQESSGPAAQPSSVDTTQFGIEDIVVTAQKRAQSINNVGMSIAAISGDTLVERGVSTAADLVKTVPGFAYAETALGVPIYTLRGIGFVDQSLSAGPTVSVYVDEVSLPYSFMTKGAIFDLERVEVLKGPQGTLYGQNSTGGAFNYIAAKPTSEFTAGVDAEYGRFNTLDATGFVSGALSSTLKGRLAVRTVQGGDWQESYTRNDSLGRQEQWQGRALLDWDPTDRLSVQINATGWIDRSDTIAPQVRKIDPQVPAGVIPEVASYPLAPESPRAADWTPNRDYGRDDWFWMATGRINYDLTDDVRLVSISAYQRFSTKAFYDNDGYSYLTGDRYGTGSVKAFSQELRVEGDSGPIQWMLGGNYSHHKVHQLFTYYLEDASNAHGVFAGLGPVGPNGELGFVGPDGINFSTANGLSDNTIKSYAIFGNAEWEITPSLTLQGGIRYTKTNRDGRSCAVATDADGAMLTQALQQLYANVGLKTTPVMPVAQGDCTTLDEDFNPAPSIGRLREDNVSWRVGLNYKTPGATLLYANVSRGYKAGSIPAFSAATYLSNAPVTQESLLAYEIGFKAPLFGRTMQLNSAAFYYDYSDKQIYVLLQDPVFGGIQQLVNIPKSRLYGAELELVWQPTRGLNISASGTYLNSRIKEYTGYNAGGIFADYSGESFPYAAKWQLAGDVQYDFPVSGSMDAYVGGSVNYHSRTTAAFGNDLLIAGDKGNYDLNAYALVDLRAGVKSPDGKWRVGFFGRNIFNKYYWTTVEKQQDAVIRYAGKPATYGIQLSTRF